VTLEDPEKAWEAIKEINSIEVSDREWQEHINSVIGCGPLEELVALNSKKLLESILIEAAQNEKLRTQLSMIYETAINNEIWLAIQNVIRNKK